MRSQTMIEYNLVISRKTDILIDRLIYGLIDRYIQ